MGQFSQVPGLAGYQQQVAFNDQQSENGLQRIGALLRLQQMKQQMDNAPQEMELNQMRRKAEIADLEARGANRTEQTNKSQQMQSLGIALSTIPKDHPDRPALVQQWNMLTNPQGAFAEEKTAALPWYVRKGQDGKMQIDPAYADFEKAKSREGKPATPYFTPVADATRGMGVFDNRTGRYTFDAASPMVRPADSPNLQGQIAGAKEAGKSGAEADADRKKANKKSDTLLSVAKQAEAMLGEDVTQSGIGAGVDAAARLVGVSPKSSQNAAKLETISGWLVSNVPRMEGPQSNYDVENYKTMAGKVGDRSVPVAERKAALNSLVELQEKYKHLNQDAAANAAPASPAAPTAKPSMDEWMAKAKAANPSASGAELQAYYYKKYGVK